VTGSAPSSRALVVAFLAAPVAWVIHLAASVALVPAACELSSVLVLHLVTVVTALAAIGGILATRRYRVAADGGHVALLSSGGFWLGVLFLVLIVLEGIPVFALEPCG
jgi:hypothetical protein